MLKWAFTSWTKEAAGGNSPDLVSRSRADVGDEMQGERRALRAAQRGGRQSLHAGAGLMWALFAAAPRWNGRFCLFSCFNERPSAFPHCSFKSKLWLIHEQRGVCASQVVCDSEGTGTGADWLQSGVEQRVGRRFHPFPETSPRRS